MFFRLLALAAVLLFAAVTVSATVRAARGRANPPPAPDLTPQGRAAWAWMPAILSGCLTMITAAVAGVIDPATAGVLAGILAACFGIGLLTRVRKDAHSYPLQATRGHFTAGFAGFAEDLRLVRGRATAGPSATPQHAIPQPVPVTNGGTPPMASQPPRQPSPNGTSPANGTRPPTGGRVRQPAIRARRVATSAGAPAIPAGWAGVVTGVADFDPESNLVYVEWLREQVTGVAATAEAFVEQHEAMVTVTGVDPVALATRQEVAEAFIACTEAIARSGSAFCQHFELPDAFVDNGGILAHEGRWHQGTPE